MRSTLATRAALGDNRGVLSALKKILRPLVPAELRRRVRFARGGNWLRGDYATWAEARADSVGYETTAELERYVTAARAVESGRGAWERDAHVFAEPEVHEPLLAALRAIAARNGGALDVVDFGGALGSTWRQHRAALAELASVRWRVVEQSAWIDAGRREFANTTLSFHASLDEAGGEPARQVLLLSSVLQYLESPRALLADALRRNFSDVIIDRTPWWRGGCDRLTVQHTPSEYGGGSYPCWVFDRATLLAPLASRFQLAAEWDGFDDLAVWARYRGWHFTRAAVR